MKLHVYCLVEPVETLPISLHGIAGVPVRRLDTGDVSVLVSDFAERSVPVTRGNALAHAAVMQSVLKATTPLPFRFGTLVTEQQLENYVAAKREGLLAKLEQVRGCVEMNVKIISERDSAEVSPAVDTQETPGTAFLAEKRREILGAEARAAEAKRVAEWLEGQLAEVVKEIDIKTNPTGRLILSGAGLVERDLVDEFRRRVAEARQQRPDLHFLVSGPWAPYSFTNMDLEFKTHFGVS
jgi:hypothetical protein